MLVVAHPPPNVIDNAAALIERAKWADAVGISVQRVVTASQSRQSAANPAMIDLTPLGADPAIGAAAAAMMNGVRVLRTSNVKPIKRVATTISELLMRRGVDAPDVVAAIGSDPCR